MDLIKRFRLNHHSRIALVGSGGKTTLMFQLARDFGSRVICTTTTHLAVEELKSADQHLTLEDLKDLPGSESELTGNIIVITGPEGETDRVIGPSSEILAALDKLAKAWNCPIIIEADGARNLPIKAPAAHEPSIPEFANVVITVIGLSGLGKPLNGDWVHRPELYSALVDLPLGSTLASEHLVKELISPQGGLKNIPEKTRKILFINQIDSFPNWKAFHSHIDVLLSFYHSVGFAVLEDQLLLEVHEQIAGIVLAAGESSRFGEPKQLLDWFGAPLVKHVAEIAIKGGLSPVLVVSGADHDAVSQTLQGSPIKIVCNTSWQVGQSTSIQAGIQALPETVGGVVFLLVDQPLIPPKLIDLIREKQSRTPSVIILPKIEGKSANPVFFDRQIFEELLQLEGDIGGRALFEKYPPRGVPWEDSASQMDIDTPEDYQRIRFESGSEE